MREEQQLIALGWPLDEAFYICRRLRLDGSLSKFIEEQWAKREPIPDPNKEVLLYANMEHQSI